MSIKINSQKKPAKKLIYDRIICVFMVLMFSVVAVY